MGVSYFLLPMAVYTVLFTPSVISLGGLKNESAPDSMSHGTPVEQPSPEVCSIPT
jgi:hypothetical protein